MMTIETTIEVDDEGNAMLHLPAGPKPGTHRAVLIVFDEAERPTLGSDSSDFPRHDIPWPFPEGYTFRREGMALFRHRERAVSCGGSLAKGGGGRYGDDRNDHRSG